MAARSLHLYGELARAAREAYANGGNPSPGNVIMSSSCWWELPDWRTSSKAFATFGDTRDSIWYRIIELADPLAGIALRDTSRFLSR